MPAFAWLAAVSAASLNLCSDELVLAIAEPEQIVSVTHLAQDPLESRLWRQARPYPRNDGSLLSIATLRPDIVVTMGGGVRDQQRIASRLGTRLITLPYPQSLDGVQSNIRTVARALGRTQAGEVLVRRMTALRSTAPKRQVDAIWLGGGGRTVPAAGLQAQWMRLAGLRQRQVQEDRVSLETLLAAPPAILLRSDYRSGQYSAAQRWLRHPLARRAKGGRTIATDGRSWTCMGPALIDEIIRLRREVGR